MSHCMLPTISVQCVQGWHLHCGNRHQDCLNNGPNKTGFGGATPSASKKVQSVQISSPPSSSTAVIHGPCLLTLRRKTKQKKKKDPGIRHQVHEETSPYLLLGAQDQRLGAKHNQLPCRPTGTCSINCQETETCIGRACHTSLPYIRTFK